MTEFLALAQTFPQLIRTNIDLTDAQMSNSIRCLIPNSFDRENGGTECWP